MSLLKFICDIFSKIYNFKVKNNLLCHGRIQRGQGVRTPPPGIARLLMLAMLKFSVRPLLGIWTPPPPPPPPPPRKFSGSAHVCHVYSDYKIFLTPTPKITDLFATKTHFFSQKCSAFKQDIHNKAQFIYCRNNSLLDHPHIKHSYVSTFILPRRFQF